MRILRLYFLDVNIPGAHLDEVMIVCPSVDADLVRCVGIIELEVHVQRDVLRENNPVCA